MEHIGSTAVPGLGAKPIIDILIGVHSLDNVEEFIGRLGQLGYEYRPQNETLIRGTWYFRKGAPGANTHHLRFVEHGGKLWEEYLLFRDYLRNQPSEAEKYCLLKRSLYEKHGRYHPLDAKNSFIDSIIVKARKTGRERIL